LFEPVYKQMVWGGGRLGELYGRRLPFEKTGESWDLSCRRDGTGIIENGPLAGISFDEFMDMDREAVLGKKLADLARFPMLIKIIDASDDLSVQVHPDDGYALTHNEPDTGKNEIWYVMEPPDSGYLIIGLKDGVDRKALGEAILNGNVGDCLNRLPVRRGDAVDIPAGLVHALTKGAVVAEVQQNSDLTYRLYDYGRVGIDGKARKLRIEDALGVIDFAGAIPKKTIDASRLGHNGAATWRILSSNYFDVRKYALDGMISENSDPDFFFAFTCVEGRVEIKSKTFSVGVPASRTVFIPAAMGAYEIRGRGVLIKSAAVQS